MQFATGLEIEEASALIAYGVNDCSAHVDDAARDAAQAAVAEGTAGPKLEPL